MKIKAKKVLIWVFESIAREDCDEQESKDELACRIVWM